MVFCINPLSNRQLVEFIKNSLKGSWLVPNLIRPEQITGNNQNLQRQLKYLATIKKTPKNPTRTPPKHPRDLCR